MEGSIKMKKSDSIVEIAKALANFRKEVKQPMKDADNPFFKSRYVPLPNVVEAIDETAPKQGLSFVQWLLNDESGQIGVATMILHTSGEFLELDPVFMKAEKQTPQGAGSLATYLKRYSLAAAFGITSDEDDDGNQATGNKSKPKQDAGKLELVKMNADVLAKVLTSKGNEQTREDIIKAYTQDANINNFTNQQLTQLANRIKAKVEQYKKEDNEQESK